MPDDDSPNGCIGVVVFGATFILCAVVLIIIGVIAIVFNPGLNAHLKGAFPLDCIWTISFFIALCVTIRLFIKDAQRCQSELVSQRLVAEQEKQERAEIVRQGNERYDASLYRAAQSERILAALKEERANEIEAMESELMRLKLTRGGSEEDFDEQD